MARIQALETGNELPADLDPSGLFRIAAVLGGGVFWFVWAYVLAGFTTFLFGFVLGDDGRFGQYLAVTAHALLVPAFGTLLTTRSGSWNEIRISRWISAPSFPRGWRVTGWPSSPRWTSS